MKKRESSFLYRMLKVAKFGSEKLCNITSFCGLFPKYILGGSESAEIQKENAFAFSCRDLHHGLNYPPVTSIHSSGMTATYVFMDES